MTKKDFITEICKVFKNEVAFDIDPETVTVGYGMVNIEDIYEYSIELRFYPFEEDWEAFDLCKENVEEFVSDMKGYEAVAEYIYANYCSIDDFFKN